MSRMQLSMAMTTRASPVLKLELHDKYNECRSRTHVKLANRTPEKRIWDLPSKFDLNQERAVPQTPSFVWSDRSKLNGVEGGTEI